MSARHFSAAPGSTIRLRVRFFSNGTLSDPLSLPTNVGMFYTASGGTAFQTLVPQRETAGIWYCDFTLPASFASTVLYDEWTWIGDTGMAPNVQRYLSEIKLESVPTPPAPVPVESPQDAVGHIFRAVQRQQKDAPKAGFVQKAVPRSVMEAAAAQSHDRLKSIAKSALEHYLRSFFDTSGRNRSAIEAIAKGSLQYITDKSLEATEDVTKRTTQLARIYNEIRERIPAILIMDSGIESVPSGLMSGLTHSALLNGKWQGWFLKQFRIPVTISILTGDQESTDQLMELVDLTLNNLRQLGGGSAIRSKEPGHNWEVRLPLTQSISATTGENITDDRKDQLWHSTFDVTLDAEDTFAVEMEFNTNFALGSYDGDIANGLTVDQPDLSSRLPPEILAPDVMRVNMPATVGFRRLRLTHKIIIDQPMIATIDTSTRTITPRRPGTFTLMVLDLNARHDDAGPRAMSPVAVVQKMITVTL
jgi:hypothetical protein